MAGLFLGLFASLLAPATCAMASPLNGVLDRSFGSGGFVQVALPDALANSDFAAMVREPDDKLVLGGRSSIGRRRSVQIVERRLPDGSLDTGFGNGGIVTVTGPGTWTFASALAVQADGRILVGAGSGVHRLLADGSPDPSFGEGGQVKSPISVDYIGVDDRGRIVLAGTVSHLRPVHDAIPEVQLAVARLQPDGSIDPGFGDGGVAEVGGDPAFEGAHGLVIRNGGMLVAATGGLVALTESGGLDPAFAEGGVAAVPGEPTALLGLPNGESLVGSRANSCSVCDPDSGDFTLTRYRADGSREPGFGSGGVATLHISETSEVTALALTGEGQILMAGRTGSSAECMAGLCALGLILARFEADGALDASFGAGGWTPLEIAPGEPGYEYAPRVTGLAALPDGRVVAAGGSRLSADAFLVGRQADGAPDSGFGVPNGLVLETGPRPSNATAGHLAFGPGGQLLLSAWSAAAAHSGREILIGLRPGGRPDPAFGEGEGFTPTADRGRFLAAGRSGIYSARGSWVARFDGSGHRDSGFGVNGAAKLPDGFRPASAAIRGDGRVLVVGRLGKHTGMAAFQITRQGVPDAGFGHAGLVTIHAAATAGGVQGVVVDRKGRAVLIGGSGPTAVVARLRPGGGPDRTFGRQGLLRLPTHGAQITQTALLPRGGLLVATSPDETTRTSFPTLVRLDEQGRFVDSFGRHGVLRVAGRSPMLALLTRERQIVIALEHGRNGDGYGVTLQGYLPNGSVDRRFGREGSTVISGHGRGRFRPAAALREPGGRILIAGTTEGFPRSVELLRFR